VACSNICSHQFASLNTVFANISLIELDYVSPLSSELQRKVLLSLTEGEKDIAKLTADIGARNTSILHILEQFGGLDLVTKTRGFYSLSSLGAIEARICHEYFSAIEVIEKFKGFWLLHDVTGIPADFLSNIGALKDSIVIKTEASELKTVHGKFMEIIQASKKIKGISPIFHPDFILLFAQLLNQGATIELIVNSNVLNKIVSFADIALIKKYLEDDSLQIFLCEDLKITLTLTANSFSLGLFFPSGEYDDNTDLISTSTEAIRWGEKLFEVFLKNSRKVGLDKIA